MHKPQTNESLGRKKTKPIAKRLKISVIHLMGAVTSENRCHIGRVNAGFGHEELFKGAAHPYKRMLVSILYKRHESGDNAIETVLSYLNKSSIV